MKARGWDYQIVRHKRTLSQTICLGGSFVVTALFGQSSARASHEELTAHFGAEEFFDSWIAGECEHDFACRFDIQAKVQKWTAAPFKRDPFAEDDEIKSGRIKSELESIGEFAAPDYRSRDCAQNSLPPIALFGR
jgi:hypothetical protein